VPWAASGVANISPITNKIAIRAAMVIEFIKSSLGRVFSARVEIKPTAGHLSVGANPWIFGLVVAGFHPTMAAT